MHPRKSKTSCCVVNCSNSYKNNAQCKFYRFPSDIRFPGRKQLWIRAVRRRQTEKNKLWIPNKNSRICSDHFAGGLKSDHPHHPSYSPTIFPVIYRKTPANTAQQENRFNRLMKRRIVLEESATNIMETFDMPHPLENNPKNDVAIQCCFDSINPKLQTVAVLFCSVKDGGVEIQTCLPNAVHHQDASTETSFKTAEKSCGEFQVNTYRDAACGPSISVQSYSDTRTMKKFENIGKSELRGVAGVTLAVFQLLLQFIPQPNAKAGRNRLLSPENRLLLFLMRIKTGLTSEALSVLWGLHRTTVSINFIEVLDCLTEATKSWIFWPSRSVIKNNMPPAFKKHYKDCRCIIDCTEIKTEIPAVVEQQVLLYSQYKHAHTLKFLVAVTPNGFISFVSNGYGGRATDSFITVDSGFLSLLERNDLVLADKGFPQIKTVLKDKDVLLVMPPFSTTEQFTYEPVEETYSVASVRIHVERCIQRIKLHKILEKVSLEHIPHINKIMYVCCVLSNLQKPIFKL